MGQMAKKVRESLLRNREAETRKATRGGRSLWGGEPKKLYKTSQTWGVLSLFIPAFGRLNLEF